MTDAQTFLDRGQAWLGLQGTTAFVGVFAAKLAAINLLPLPHLNGGQAALALTGLTGDGEGGWIRQLMIGSAVLWWLSAGSWCVAVAYHLLAH
ncbi:hypothetical protein [Luteimonas terrae]|uniref:Membrane-associated protease RseP (Regulator of RpoE activity) n=1 Tax=Luteimonas terrae TaxID=1530191 RepID=A0ABU1XRJ5_9GAMM|nr:hypothetical protein [Luteimonas terrae]MDR7191385.1 membrane-associated protease RseP (regulator of RpoE activity) [Luteimonas terrae]